MKSCLALFTLVSAIASFFTSEASPAGCADTCTDYHRLCPAIVNPGFINEYKAKLEAGALPNLPRKQIPDFQCTNEEIRIVCPMSCGMCVPCSKARADALAQHVTALEDEFKEIKDSGAALSKDEGLVNVIGMLADPAFHGHTETTIDKAFQGTDDSTTSNCYISDSPNNNQASIDIYPSAVTKLEFLNRKDCCTDWTNGIQVKVCVKGGACANCGNPPNVAPGAWSTVTCQGTLKGNQIFLKNADHHLQFCELKIYGTPLKADAFKKLHPIEVTGMLADPAYHGHPETTIDKAFEGSHSANYKDCYVSNTNGKAGASIDIEPAKVVQIILLNRKDCCTDWLHKIEIRVCVKGGSCQFCGKPDPVPPGAWAWVTCQAQLEGNEIQLYNPAHHLQFCEMKILGNPLAKDEFPKLEKISVTGMLADPAYHGHPFTTIDKAFEGSDSWDHKQCYVSNPNGQAQASIDIEPATVYQIKLLNRGDCCTEWLDKINIKVCIKGGACHICGNPDAVPGGSWSTVTCMGGPIEGNEIQLRNEAHHLQFCEMVIYGIPIKKPTFKNLKAIQVTGMEASDPWPGHKETVIQMAFEGSDVYHYTKCFVSATPTGGDFANIDIEKSAVAQIKLLNRGDCCDKWMDTIEIRVCNKGGACSFCGKPAAVAAGTWATITCQGGAIEGDEIKLVNPVHHLQFCEMKIYGTSLK